MQNINVKCAADAADLEERREIDHGTHLSMCRKAYWKQARAGRHAHIEHPEQNRAWKTKAFSIFVAMLLCLTSANIVPQQSTMMDFPSHSRSPHESKPPRMQRSIS